MVLRDLCQAEVARICEQTCAALGGSAEVVYRRGYPCLINHAAETQLMRDVARVRATVDAFVSWFEANAALFSGRP